MKCMENNFLIKPFEDSIYLEELKDVTVDFAELGLDELTNMVFGDVPNALSNIPIIRTAVALGKIGWGIKKATVLRNQLAFIKALQQGKPDPAAVEKRIEALKNHEKWIEKEVETTVVYLERYTHTRKAQYQAGIYGALLNGIIFYEQYEEYLAILDQMLITDTKYLYDVVGFSLKSNKGINEKSLADQNEIQFNAVCCRRLESLGLLLGSITMYPGTSSVDKYLPTHQGLFLYSMFSEKKDSTHPRLKLGPNNDFVIEL